jgi:hypothetical protein
VKPQRKQRSTRQSTQTPPTGGKRNAFIANLQEQIGIDSPSSNALYNQELAVGLSDIRL